MVLIPARSARVKPRLSLRMRTPHNTRRHIFGQGYGRAIRANVHFMGIEIGIAAGMVRSCGVGRKFEPGKSNRISNNQITKSMEQGEACAALRETCLRPVYFGGRGRPLSRRMFKAKGDGCSRAAARRACRANGGRGPFFAEAASQGKPSALPCRNAVASHSAALQHGKRSRRPL